MNDLRTAQQALDALEEIADEVFSPYDNKLGDAILTLRAALAEPVLNPAPGYCKHCKQYTIEEPLPAEPVEEPVAYIHRQGNYWEVSERELVDDERARGWTEDPLYTAPPQRKPLTEEEIRDLWSWAMTAEAERTATTQQHAFARAIERAHGITGPEDKGG